MAMLNKSTAKWLPRLRDEVVRVYGKSWAFHRMCDTRWNSMQAMFASLLQVETGVRMFVSRWKSSSEFPEH